MTIAVYESFLSTYFALFDARIEQMEFENGKISGSVIWVDEKETQEFSWIPNISLASATRMAQLCKFLGKTNILQGDKFLVTEEELQSILINNGWIAEDAKTDIDTLCEVEVDMIDGGEKTDSFYLHF